MKSTLILTSIGKLEEFQVYLVAGILPNGMSDEQRGKLAGEELDLDEYKNFLINEYGLQGKYVDALCRRASDLKSGNGIRYSRWPDGAVFHPKPIGMDEDFHRLQQDAILHMRNHSTCHYSVLMTPINKLMSFQEFYYKRKFASEAPGGVSQSDLVEKTSRRENESRQDDKNPSIKTEQQTVEVGILVSSTPKHNGKNSFQGDIPPPALEAQQRGAFEVEQASLQSELSTFQKQQIVNTDPPSVQMERPKTVLSMQPAVAEAAHHSIHPPGEAKQGTQNAETPMIHEEQPAAVLSMSEDYMGVSV